MQAKGSLFLQHLRLEAEVQVNSDGLFQQFLALCNFTPPSHAELGRCELALYAILAWPNDERTDLWKADWLYCVLRDYLVKRLASQDVLAFGITNISEAMTKLWGVTGNQLQCLNDLRLNKAKYRSGSTGVRMGSPLFSSVAKLLAIIAYKRVKSCVQYPATIEEFDAFTLNTDYQWLRALEGIYILAQSAVCMHSSHESLMKLIMQPNLLILPVV